MTARRSPHYAAVVRAQVKRKAKAHMVQRAYARIGGVGLAKLLREQRPMWRSTLVDQPLTEEQKATRWEGIWKR